MHRAAEPPTSTSEEPITRINRAAQSSEDQPYYFCFRRQPESFNFLVDVCRSNFNRRPASQRSPIFAHLSPPSNRNFRFLFDSHRFRRAARLERTASYIRAKERQPGIFDFLGALSAIRRSPTQLPLTGRPLGFERVRILLSGQETSTGFFRFPVTHSLLRRVGFSVSSLRTWVSVRAEQQTKTEAKNVNRKSLFR